MKLAGINHITIAVRDLDRSFRFYSEVLGFQPLARWSEGAYFLAGDLWFCISRDENTRNEILPEYTHVAFSVDQANFDAAVEHLRRHDIRKWKDNASEGDSFYFLDPDGYKLELHVGNWKTRIEEMKRDPWEEGIQFFETGPLRCEFTNSKTQLDH